jgi:hypothetical protein
MGGKCTSLVKLVSRRIGREKEELVG